MQIEINNRTKQKIDEDLIKKIVQKFAKDYKKEKHEISIAFVGDKRIRAINRKYRKIDKITDILAFEENDKKSFFLGELILNCARIKKQAHKYKNTFKKELIFILVHGLFHLLGYEDKDEKGLEQMKSLGEEFIKKHNLYKNV